MNFEHEAIFCIVNAGFSDTVMDAAKKFGARGGTVIHARGTANSEAERMFEITVHPEKEIVMILVPSAIKNDILHALYREVGLATPGQGIAFCLPGDDVVGIAKAPESEKAESLPQEKQLDPSRKPTPIGVGFLFIWLPQPFTL